MTTKKSKRVAFTFDERSTTTLENMAKEGYLSGCTEITIQHPDTGKRMIIKLPRSQGIVVIGGKWTGPDRLPACYLCGENADLFRVVGGKLTCEVCWSEL